MAVVLLAISTIINGKGHTTIFKMISTRTKKYTPMALYSKITEAYYSKILINESDQRLLSLIDEFKKNLEILTKFFLEDRFVAQPRKLRQRDPLELKKARDPKSIKSVDFMFMTGELPVKPKAVALNHMHLLIFYKVLETFILRRVWIENIEEMELGHFLKIARSISDILPKLLLVIESTGNNKKELFEFIFSIISIYRQFKLNTKPDTSTIAANYMGKDLKKLLSTEFSDMKISEWLSSLDNKLWDIKYLRLSIYSGNASSPNSGASATRIIEDASAVRLDPVLSKSLLLLAQHFPNGDHFIYLAKILFENIKDISGTVHSKLFHFTAKGGKARIIANVDWLTQTALSGLHFFLYRILSSIDSDFTFDHKKGLPYIWSEDKEYNFYSVDLKAATDRMPRVLQAQLIKGILNKLGLDGETISKLWLNIMDREFSTKNSSLNNEQPLRYAVGQGMGVFTSWPVMALLHHFIVNCVCGIDTHNYALVGDDLVIRGKKEDYNKYCALLTKIGMQINANKTIVSEEKDHTVEFARNYIIKGISIKPIEFGILYAWNDQMASFQSFFYAMRSSLNSHVLLKLTAAFEVHLTLPCLLEVLYFFWKYKILESNNIISSISNLLRIPEWVTKIDWAKFHDAVTLTHRKQKPSREGELLLADDLAAEQLGTQADFMQTFKSDLIVRNKIDASRARDLADRLIYLKFIDDHIGYMALQLSKRMFNVELIQYDIDDFGNPLVSKRARNLIREMILHWSEDPSHIAPNEETNVNN